jgi:CRP/FNR family transcriptional regulator, cyclic AMP receptor protein
MLERPHELRPSSVELLDLPSIERMPTTGSRWSTGHPSEPAQHRPPGSLPGLRDMVRACAGARDFAGLSPEAWAELESAAQKRRYDHNGFIYLQEDVATHLYFVVSGHVRISSLLEDGTAVLHAILPPGESFGELGVFEESTYCDMATAIGPSVVTGVSIPILRTLRERHPEIRDALAGAVARRYRGYVMMTRDLSLKTLTARLAQAILRLAGQLGTRTPYRGRPVRTIAGAVTQSDLGLMARGSRGNVNRVLKTWERAGWIAIVDRCILILEQGRLEALAVEDC